MIKSMTGFGHAEKVTEQCRITVEMKSVNHRYLDLNIKMPRRFNMLEGQVRNLMKQYMQRGKVDVFITYENYTSNDYTLKYNNELAAEYLSYLNQMAEEFHLENDVRVTTLSRYPEVEARTREGQHLKEDLLDKLAGLDEKVDRVEERSPKVVQEYREKLEQKVHELLEDSQIDDSRIAAEVVLFSDKICNDEETVRLHSHIHGMQKILEEKEGVGRKMDFMAQEMNREANTILSKSSDLEVSDIAIDLKTEIEKIREQIQNIE